MAKTLSLPSPRQVSAQLVETALRFPLPLAAAVLAALQGIAMMHGWHLWGGAAETGQRFTFLALVFFAFLAAKLIAESRGWAGPLQLALAALLGALVAARVFTLPADSLELGNGPLLLLAPCLVLLVMVAPFLRRGAGDNPQFWEFNRASWISAGIGLAAAIILAIGLSSALYAIETLFDAQIDGDIFSDLWLVCLSLVWPWLALSGLPRRFDVSVGEVPEAFKTLALYILIPLVALYLIILYAYMGRIAMLWAWPKGQVATLVSIYATLGVATFVLIYPLRRKGSGLARFYGHAFFPALYLPLAVLVLALWRRVSEYGVTEARYAVGLFGLWLLICALYGAWNKRPRLIVLPLTLTVLLGFAAVGPWGATNVSTRSQVAQLEAVLVANQLMVDGKLRKSQQVVPFEASKRISSIVSYLIDNGKNDALMPLFVGNPFQPKVGVTTPQVIAAMGVLFVQAWQDKPSFSFRITQDQVFNVAGFNLLARVQLDTGRVERLIDLQNGEVYQLQLDSDGKELVVSTPNGQSALLDLGLLAGNLMQGEMTEFERTRLMTVEAESGNIQVRLYFETLNGLVGEAGPEITNATGIVLIGKSH